MTFILPTCIQPQKFSQKLLLLLSLMLSNSLPTTLLADDQVHRNLGKEVNLPLQIKSSEEDSSISVGSDLYPSIARPSDPSRFDPSSNLLVNTIGAKIGLFGAASREGLTWANRYVPGADVNGVVQLYSLSTTGNYGAFFGARSSDNRSVRGENVIGSVNLVVADGDRPHLHWAQYSEGYVPSGKTAFRLLINDENSIQNEGSPAPLADPYNINPQRLLNNLRIDCGVGINGAKSCTNPLSIVHNGAAYRLGILFGDASIEINNGAADAIAFPAEYALSWFGSPGRRTWRLYSNARRADAGQLIMTDDALVVRLGSKKGTPALSIGVDAVAAPAVIASGSPPDISGSCPVLDRLGGQSAGSFRMAGDCTAGNIVFEFSAMAPNGWACFGSNLSNKAGELREISFTQSSATLAVSNFNQSDKVVFSCTGF